MHPLKQLTFTSSEKAALAAKATAQLHDAGLSAVIVTGSANLTYLTQGIVFPFLDQKIVHPVALFWSLATDQRVLVCPFDLSHVPPQLGWDGEVLTYELTACSPEKSLAAALAQCVSAETVRNRTVGYDFDATSGALLDAFVHYLPNHEVQPLDETLRSLRMVKSSAEIRLLEIASRMGDRGFISALNHAEGAALDTLSYPMWEYGERFRVHVGEFGGSGVGNLAVLRGNRGQHLYGLTPTRETFSENEFIRMEYSVHSHGYWVTGARTVYAGFPDAQAEQTWADNVRMTQAAVAALRAGTRASDVYAAVMQASDAAGIEVWRTNDVGHGVGTSEREAPFLAPYDQTELQPGMVVAVAVYTFTPDRQLVGNKDIYEITDGNARLLTWYKDWRRLYALHGTSARHG